MMPTREFEKLVAEGFGRLPQWVRERVANVVILVSETPTHEQLREHGLDPEIETLLGLYTGVPLSERGSDYGVGATLPDAITLFQKPIEEAAGGNPEKVREIVADTVWHEFAHHFGIDEEGVREREQERGIGDFRG